MTIPWAINEAGSIVGRSDTKFMNPATSMKESHACLWSPDGKIVDLTNEDDMTDSDATFINEKGLIVGHYHGLPAIFHAGEKPTLLALPDLGEGAPQVRIEHVSADGTILATYNVVKSTNVTAVTVFDTQHIVRWTNASLQGEDLGNPPHDLLAMLPGLVNGITDEGEWWTGPPNGHVNNSVTVVGYRHHRSERAYAVGHDPLLPGATAAELSPQPVFWTPSMKVDKIIGYPGFAKLAWLEVHWESQGKSPVFNKSIVINDEGTIAMTIPDRKPPALPVPAIPAAVQQMVKAGKTVVIPQANPVIPGTVFLVSRYGEQFIDLSDIVGVRLNYVLGLTDAGAVLVHGIDGAYYGLFPVK
jgi:hypothetical protein